MIDQETHNQARHELARIHNPRRQSEHSREIDDRPITHGPYIARNQEETENEHNRSVPVWYPGSYSPEALVWADQVLKPLIRDFEAYLVKKEIQDEIKFRTDSSRLNGNSQEASDSAMTKILDLVQNKLARENPKVAEVIQLIYVTLYKLYGAIDKKQPKTLADSINKDETTPWRGSYYSHIVSIIGNISLLQLDIDKDLLELLKRARTLWEGGTMHAPNNRKLIDPHEIPLARLVLWSIMSALPKPPDEILNKSLEAFLKSTGVASKEADA